MSRPDFKGINNPSYKHGHSPKYNNCKWSDKVEQARTRSNTLNYDGKSLRQKCVELGIDYKAAHARLKTGKDPLTPLRESKRNG